MHTRQGEGQDGGFPMQKQLPHIVAVLYQAIDPPAIDGVRKPRKPGGYQDSGADIAYTLRSRGLVTVLTPTPSPTPTQQDGWCFADSEAGILEALERGATHLWANTVLFQAHPLQASATLKAREDEMWVVGQPPRLVEVFDDKAAANDWLRRRGKFTLPWCRVIDADSDLEKLVQDIGGQFPVIGKPIRGRGSYGVKRCDYVEQLKVHARTLLAQTSRMIVEEYLDGDEGTVTVMPPSPQRNEYWCLPLVVRFNHVDGVAPYNGVIAVTANSRAATQAEQNDPAVISILDQCKNIAELMGATAPIRIDVRRFKPGAEFALFDINMKPNMTGPGRPGRENQASLTAIAAAALGWDYGVLLQHILYGAQPLSVFRNYRSPM